jgi:hypothetical protein
MWVSQTNIRPIKIAVTRQAIPDAYTAGADIFPEVSIPLPPLNGVGEVSKSIPVR